LQANIINRFGGVKIEKIRGLRVPFLKPGWNRQFLMMKEFGFVYDSSIPAPLSDPPIWPYTLDFKIPHKCIGRRKCPSRSFPGLWVSPPVAGSGHHDHARRELFEAGLPDFSWYNIPKRGKIHQITIKYTM
jgi:hypothetical protein